MNKWVIALVAFFVVCIISAVSMVAYVSGVNNNYVALEESVIQQYKQNQNNFSNMVNSVVEVAKVPSQYASDLKEVVNGAIKGRYGEDGSKAVFQMLKEQNPTLDSSLYKQIQQVIEAGRASFQADQKTLLDKKRIYQQELRMFPNNMIASFLGFPKIKLEEYDIVTSEDTEKAFKEKKAGPIDVFQKEKK